MYAAKFLLFFVNIVFGLIALIIGLRIILMLFGANPYTPFVKWIYDVSETIIYPFQGIFPSPVLDGGFVLEISAIVALLVYALIAYFITELIRFISYKSTYYYTKDGKTKIIREE